MKIKLAVFLLMGLLAMTGVAPAQIDTNGLDQKQLAALAKMESIIKGLKYQEGTIVLRGGLATLKVPPDFRYLGPDDTEKVLVDLWHNPPLGKKLLGMLIPAGMTPLSSNAWVVTINYIEDGYVKDADASKINYDDLLKKMQQDVAEGNKEREAHGYPAITLVGWAAPPHYDADTHKLYWAKNVKFEGETENTLNYSIRMLGRKGVLELNAISSLDQFQEIDKQTPQILGMVDFNEGNRYADFDPKVDKVATYGLAALVAGGALVVAAKAGLLKVIIAGIFAAKKLIIVGAVAVAAIAKKVFGGKSKDPTA